MLKKYWALSLLAGLCCTVSVSANMLPNGDWEGESALGRKREDNSAWTAPEKAQKNSTAEIVAEGDNHALHLQTPANSQHRYALVCSRNLPVIAGCRYKLTFSYKSKGLLKPDANFAHGVYAPVDVFVHLLKPDGKGVIRVPNANRKERRRVENSVDFSDWTEKSLEFSIPAMPGKLAVQIRPQLVNGRANHAAEVWYDNFVLLPLDNGLPNPGFEEGVMPKEGAATATAKNPAGREMPAFWEMCGSGEKSWDAATAHSGKKSVSVSDTADSGRILSGWTTLMPVRHDREYSLKGWAKGGKLNPNGFIGGAALQMSFLDAGGTVIGDPVTSPAVEADTDWREIETPYAQAPQNACFVRLTAGTAYCNGSAWFDDLALNARPCATAQTVMLERNAQADVSVQYAKNLISNGDVEAGENGKPAHWHYEGKADKDWTEKDIFEFHNFGRTPYRIGRGRGEWSRSQRYAGEYALLNVSIDPPLSKQGGWHGRMPVAGRWVSDPVPCEPGKAYLAGGWVRPGVNLVGEWWGPFYIEFLDANGKVVNPAKAVRSPSSNIPGGVWSYFISQPHIAGAKAVKMRMIFGHEAIASTGGGGETYADNLALWEMPQPEESLADVQPRAALLPAWFQKVHHKIKPPYLAAPAKAPEYVSVWAQGVNVTTGNIFYTPDKPVKQKFTIINQLGEERTLRVVATRYDAWGNAIPEVVSQPQKVSGYSRTEIEFEFPPTGSYGAFCVDAKIMENNACVGNVNSRYAVLPPLERPHTAYNPFAVTSFVWSHTDPARYNSREKEIMECLRIGGFGIAWERANTSDPKFADYQEFSKETEVLQRVIAKNAELGLKTVLQIHVPWPTKIPHPRPPLDKDMYFKIGQNYGRAFGGKVLAFTNHGIEQLNHADKDHPGAYRGGKHNFLTDDEYDTMMACVYDGIKSVSPESTVLTGNIATDFEANNLKRVSQAPGNGKFDGAALNCYMGALMCCRNSLKVFDQYGATHKTVWWEEHASQRSPFTGPERRYGEVKGAEMMVRTWISMLGKVGPRLKAVTMWGFCPPTAQDIMMMTPNVQPRPQYAAHAVMADFLADAAFKQDRSANSIDLYEWTRTDGPVFIAWSEMGEKTLTVEVPSGKMTVMDIFGNRRAEKVVNGLATLKLTPSPVFIADTGAMTVSKRVTVNVANATRTADKPEISVKITNNSGSGLSGKLHTRLGDKELSLADKAVETVSFALPAENFSTARRQTWEAVFTTADGAVFAGSAVFVPVFAVRGTPVLDGTWTTWEKAPRIKIGENAQLNRLTCNRSKEKIIGEQDLNGYIRMLWDEKNLYLGVEALDDAYVPYDKEDWGFKGDSIEFAIQPDGILSLDAQRYEYEFFMPAGAKTPILNRRFPAPAGKIEGWRQVVRPAGKAGNVNYQIAIPWAELRTVPTPGKRLGMALFLNDKDLPSEVQPFNERCWKTFFDGISSKNPAKYGDVFLAE